jgi:peptidoglycan/xylan/chitin deacetylase (PgdA/CDA1 family)
MFRTIARHTILVLIFACTVVSLASAKEKRTGKEICITFDDLPVARVEDPIERMQITDRILYTLDEFDAPAAGFVVCDNINDDWEILRQWLSAGHILGNHSWSHPDLNDIPIKLFLQNVKQCEDALEPLLTEFHQEGRYFRYPYLHYGSRYKDKFEVAKFIHGAGYRIAHVSIDTEDYLYNLQFEKIYATYDSLEFVRLGNEYIDHIVERLAEAEKLADNLLGRKIIHIMLLHANRLNAEFLGDILGELAAMGYHFVSLDKALSDPVYSMQEGYVGAKGLSYLERLMKSDPDLLPARER